MEELDFKGLDLKGLKELCQKRGLKTYGTKKLMRERLTKHATFTNTGPCSQVEETFNEDDWSKPELMAACDKKGISHLK